MFKQSASLKCFDQKIKMKIAHVSFADVPQLAKTDLAYATNNPNLRPFFHYTPSVEAFEKVMEDKSREIFSRNILVEVLENQYRNLPPIDAVVGNIAALKNKKTFTIVTAHQPLLFTGPLYFIYKIIAVINVTKKLKSVYSDFHFVPVFVIGGEDHDFEEVNHAHLFGKKITWQNDEKGAVGFMKSALLAEPLAELTEILGNSEAAQKIISLLKDAYLNTEKYVEATLSLLHHLFGADGLVVLSMHHSALKRLFIPVMRDELLHQTSKKIIDKTIEELSVLGYKTQAAPRDINLFYLREQLRERIVKEGAGYKVWNTDLVFSEAEIVDELENFPERFSPNVVLRPLFQEIVLPNLAYVGGGGELAYWLERIDRKSVV